MNYSSTPSKPTKPLVVPLSEIQEYDYSKDFKPWTLEMIYEAEPVNEKLIEALRAEANPFEPGKDCNKRREEVMRDTGIAGSI